MKNIFNIKIKLESPSVQFKFLDYLQARYIYFFILALNFIFIIQQIEKIFGYKLPFFRYFINFLATFYLIRSVLLIPNRFIELKKIQKLMLYSIIFYSFYIILVDVPLIFSESHNYLYLKKFISGDFLLYILPLILLIKPNLLLYNKLFRLLTFFSLFYLVITLPLISYFVQDIKNGAESFSSFFAACSSMLILTYPYHSKRIVYISFLANFVALLITAYLTRRNQVVYFSSVLLFTIITTFLFKSSIKKKYNHYLKFFVLFLSLSFLIIMNLLNLTYSPLFQKFETGFSNREVVFDDFFNDFSSSGDWFLGRGIFGEYYSKSNPVFSWSFTRDTIENGYFFYILKGGLMYLILFISISLVAIFWGYFRSKNLLSKAFASILMINLIDMVGFGLPSLSMRYVILWFAIAGCFSSWLRSQPDNLLEFYIGQK